MPLRELYGKSKKTAKKAARDVKRAERKIGDVADRGIEAHRRGSREVTERFGRANREVGEFAAETFAPPLEDDAEEVGMGPNVGFGGSGESDTIGMEFNDVMGGGDDADMSLPDPMGMDDSDDDDDPMGWI